MDRLEAIKTMQSRRPQTATRLTRAIKALGNSKEEIVSTLVSLGFSRFDQGEVRACPVCAYLLSLGFKSPYVDTVGVGCEGTRVVFSDINAHGMTRVQYLASQSGISEFGGYKED